MGTASSRPKKPNTELNTRIATTTHAGLSPTWEPTMRGVRKYPSHICTHRNVKNNPARCPSIP